MESSTLLILRLHARNLRQRAPKIRLAYNRDILYAEHRSTTSTTFKCSPEQQPLLPLPTALNHLLTMPSCSWPPCSMSPFRRRTSMNWQPLTICTTNPEIQLGLHSLGPLRPPCHQTDRHEPPQLPHHRVYLIYFPPLRPKAKSKAILIHQLLPVSSHPNSLLTTGVASPMTSIPCFRPSWTDSPRLDRQ